MNEGWPTKKVQIEMSNDLGNMVTGLIYYLIDTGVFSPEQGIQSTERMSRAVYYSDLEKLFKELKIKAIELGVDPAQLTEESLKNYQKILTIETNTPKNIRKKFSREDKKAKH